MTAEELVATVVFNSDGLAPAIVQDAAHFPKSCRPWRG